MEKDKYVHCTNCIHCKLDNEAKTNCGHENECNCFDPEDGRRYAERPFFVERPSWMYASLEDAIDMS